MRAIRPFVAGTQPRGPLARDDLWRRAEFSARRNYSRDLSGVDVAVTGVPYDNAVTFRPGCRLGPQAIRAASVQLSDLLAFPFGFDPFETLSVVDYGDVHLDPHHPDTVHPAIEAHADAIIASGRQDADARGGGPFGWPIRC